MTKLRSPPILEPNPEGGWQLVFQVGEPFGRSTAFRDLLAAIAASFGPDGPAKIELPVFEDGEDFVEGRLFYGGQSMEIYYEHSLGYLALAGDETLLRLVAERYGKDVRVLE